MRTFYQWLHSHGARRDPVFHGWHWPVSAAKQREVMAGLQLQMRGVRVTTKQIPNFPDLDIQCQMVDVDDVEAIEKNYVEIKQANETLRTRAATDKNPEAEITKILRARQKIELLKAGAAIELARDKMDTGFSVGLFVNFRQTVEEISRQLSCLFIDGTNTDAERQRAIDLFQKNETKALVINSAAGGVAISLQDLDGEHPRMGLIFPGFSATVLTQVLGRFRRDGGRSKCHYRILLAANTIERRIKAVLDQKMNNLSALLDSDLIP